MRNKTTQTSTRHPVLLPRNHPMTTLIVKEASNTVESDSAANKVLDIKGQEPHPIHCATLCAVQKIRRCCVPWTLTATTPNFQSEGRAAILLHRSRFCRAFIHTNDRTLACLVSALNGYSTLRRRHGGEVCLKGWSSLPRGA